MVEQAPAHTYGPDYADFVNWLMNWLLSSGNILTDLVLQALGILITVTLIRWYFEQREKARWLPAKQTLYSELFIRAMSLVLDLTKSSRREEILKEMTKPISEQRSTFYRFGPAIGVGDPASLKDFGPRLYNDLSSADFKEIAEVYAQRPELIEGHRQLLDRTLGPWVGIFLASDPELNKLVNELDKHLADVEAKLKFYRRGADTLDQVAITLRRLALTAYALWAWLAERAEKVDRGE